MARDFFPFPCILLRFYLALLCYDEVFLLPAFFFVPLYNFLSNSS